MQAQPGNSSPNFSFSSLRRCRWNVVDLITSVGRRAVPSYLIIDVDMSWAEKLRQRFRSQGKRLTVTAILLKAIALAQRHHPASRSSALPLGRIVTFENIVAGFTVERSVNGNDAVFFGVIKEPDTKPLDSIMQELSAYADCDIDMHPELRKQSIATRIPRWARRVALWFGVRVPSLRLVINEATYGLTSLGKYGIAAVGGPCICTATFGVGSVEERVCVVNKTTVVRPMMALSLSYDQNVIDGDAAARFVHDVVTLLEGELEEFLDSPSRMDPSSGPHAIQRS